MGVWDSFGVGMRQRGALEDHRNQLAEGDAFRTGGYDAAETEAASRGDFEGAQNIGTTAQAKQRSAIEHARATATVMSNAASGLMGVPYEQRRARLQQMAPMLQGYGIPSATLEGFDPTDENLANVRAMDGHFSQYQDLQVVNGNVVGIKADGSHDIIGEHLPEATPSGYDHGGEGGNLRGQPGGPVPGVEGYRFSADGRSIEEIPGYSGTLDARAKEASIDYTGRRGFGTNGRNGSDNLSRLTPQERTFVMDARNTATRWANITRSLDRFEVLNREQPTGDFQQFNYLDPKAQEMRSITSGLVSFMRQPGEGAMSDGDAARFQASLPGMDKYGAANTNIIQGLRAAAQNTRSYAEFLDYYAGQMGSTSGAQETWNEYLNATPILTEQGQFNPHRQTWQQFFNVSGGQSGGMRGGGGDPLGLRQ